MLLINKNSLIFLVLAVLSLFFVGDAMSGTTGASFTALYTFFKELVLGFGGKAIAIAAVALGGIISIARVNPIPALAGVGFAIFMQFTPGIIEVIMTATI
ncbi:hypothetical protein [Nitrosomonas mobilis]|jgi:conjugal transfer pilus assembly protein TraA|uniref:Putative pilin subunit n=1 Tax=Nitrosomonas mobilis TaxID=51642 RepID=A0A1G5SCU9_9PROT|nr:hypothetical protein [Nitrosomonas mobilis]SCZ85026.1 putative pilin subunit [Nitrosomonas mobilis]HNO76227.1 hypothetical protein [Nitrosomonas mobilis]